MTVVVGLDGAEALGLAAERFGSMKERVVIALDERLELHAQELAVAQHAAVMIGQTPRSRIDVEPRVESAFLGESPELGVAVAAPQRPIAAARAGVIFEHLHLVAGFAQLVGRHETGDTRAEHEHRGSGRCAAQLDRPLVAGVRGEAEAGHRLIHRGASRRCADH